MCSVYNMFLREMFFLYSICRLVQTGTVHIVSCIVKIHDRSGLTCMYSDHRVKSVPGEGENPNRGI